MAEITDYVVEGEPIGHGKFSVVWKARHGDSHVAVKKVQIFEMMDPGDREKCLSEVALLQSLSHPNIIRYINSFLVDNELIIVLELAEGGDLSNYIRGLAGTPMPEQQVWNFFLQICSALQHMHQNRVMHRDIKPGNVFLSADGSLKLGDLGLSRFFSSKTVEAHSMVGTPYYMSPERIRETGYSFKSDIWSLGCLLYEMMMQRPPFYAEGLNFYTLGKKISNCEYAPIPEIYSPYLRELVSVMLQPKPEDRADINVIFENAQKGAMLYAQSVQNQ